MKIDRQFELRLRVGLVVCVLAILLGSTCAAAVVDRIVATVNHHVILESEWEEAVRFECLMNGRTLKDVTPAQRKQVLERLIDQTLIEQEMRDSSYVPASVDQVKKRLGELRESNPAWKTEEGWQAALASFGLTQDDAEERVSAQTNLLHYLDLRFRSDVHIDRKTIERYYLEQLLPQLHRAGAPEVPMQQVAAKIEQLLIEQQLNELQDRWVRALRAQAEIEVR